MKPGRIFYALLLVLVFGTIFYLGCVFDKSGIRGGTPPTVIPPPDGCTNQYYLYDINSYFGVYHFSPFPQYQVVSGSLPPGLTLDSGSGIVSGIPSQTGDFQFQVEAVSVTQEVLATGDFRIRINDFSIITAQLPPVCDSTPYSAVIEICGGVPPFTWEAINWDPALLPMSFADPGPTNARQNILAGTVANAAGDYRFTVRVTDSRGDAFRIEKEIDLEVMEGVTILTPRHLPTAVAGVSYSHGLEACGGMLPHAWEKVSAEPAFLSLDPSSGMLSGIPTAAGAFLFKVKVADANGSFTEKWFSLTVAASPLTLSQTSVNCVECMPNPGCAQDLSVMLSGGMGAPQWQLAAGSVLPPDLSLGSTGILSGTGMIPGSFNFTVEVFDTTVDPANPPRGTVTVNIVQNPQVNSIAAILRARHGAYPFVAGEPPFDQIDYDFAQNVKIDFEINDAGWDNIWRNSLPNREARLRVEGYCGFVSASDFRTNAAGFHVAVFLWNDFTGMIASINDGSEDGQYTIVLELSNGETAARAYARHAITVVNEP